MWLRLLKDGAPFRRAWTSSSSENCVQFKADWKGLHMGRAIPNQHWLGKKGFASSPEKKDLRVLVDEKLGMSVTCTHSSESQPCPWLHHKKHYQQVKGSDSFSLPFSLVTSYLEYCIHPWGPNIRRRWMCWKESREGH